MSNIHTDDDGIAPLIGCNRFRVRFRSSKIERIYIYNKKKEEGDDSSQQSYTYVIPLWLLIRRLIDGYVLKVGYNHHQYSYRKTVVTYVYNETLFTLFVFFPQIVRKKMSEYLSEMPY